VGRGKCGVYVDFGGNNLYVQRLACPAFAELLVLLLVSCDRLSWLAVSFLAHTKLSYRITQLSIRMFFTSARRSLYFGSKLLLEVRTLH